MVETGNRRDHNGYLAERWEGTKEVIKRKIHAMSEMDYVFEIFLN